MTDHIVVDVEIQKNPDELPGGWDATDLMGVAVACCYSFLDDRFRFYGKHDVDALRARIIEADRISGFNFFRFDLAVIFGLHRDKQMTELLPKTNDILRRIWLSKGLDPDNFDKRTHGGYSLDMICQDTLGRQKIGNGADAPKWYQAGEILRVATYCLDDVSLERDLTAFVDRYGFVTVGGRVIYLTDEKCREGI